MAVQRRVVTAFRALPAYAIVIDAPRGVRGDGRQSHGVPVLPASDAPPGATGLERALGQSRGRVAHRTCRELEDLPFIVEQHCYRVWS
jgi:hypothetical protein